MGKPGKGGKGKDGLSRLVTRNARYVQNSVWGQLMAEPAFLLLDEPASGVNPANLDRLVSLLRGLVERGIGIVVIDHNLSFIMDVADHVYVLANGAVLTDGPPHEISQDERVIDIYLGSRA